MSTNALPAGVTVEQVRAAIARLDRVPVEAREFNRTMVEAWRYYHLKRGLLLYLTANGMPHLRTADGILFDHADLANIGMYLGLGPFVQSARRLWPAGLNRPVSAGPNRYEVSYLAACTDPGHPPPCRYQLTLPGGATLERVVDPTDQAPLVSVEVAVDPDWPRLPAELRDWISEACGFEWMLLPPGARHDLEFIRKTRLADCWGSAEILLLEGQRRGLPVRRSTGFIAAPPYSSIHNWVDIQLDGRWVPVDPHLISLLLEWGVLDPAQWSPDRSPGAIFCRVGDLGTRLAIHDGTPTRVALATRLLTAE